MIQPVAIIIARGGSQRLKRKNVLPFCGHPLVEWSIMQACCSHCFTKEDIYLSTDDDEIAHIGDLHEINVIRRPVWENPNAISGNTVYRHAINTIREKRHFDVHINIMPTSPIRLPEDLDNIFLRYLELKKLYPDCREVDWTIPQREIVAHKYMDDARMIFWLFNKSWWFGMEGIAAHIYEPDYYIEISSDYSKDAEIDNTNLWMKPGKTGRVIYYMQGKWFQQFEIDDQDSFELCEIMMERYILKGRGAWIYYQYKNGGKK